MAIVSELVVPKQKVFPDGSIGYQTDMLVLIEVIPDVEDLYFKDGRLTKLFITHYGIYIPRQDDPNYCSLLLTIELAVYSEKISAHKVVQEHF